MFSQNNLLLLRCSQANNFKLFQLFLSSLFHFAKNILNEKNNGKEFLIKYFNYNNCKSACYGTFFVE